MDIREIARGYRAGEKDRAKLGYNPAERELKEGLAANPRDCERVSIREMFEELVPDGREAVRNFNPKYASSAVAIREANAVQSGAFANVSGIVVTTMVEDSAKHEDFIGDLLCTTRSSPYQTERLPMISDIGDEAELVGEGEAYPLAGVTEDWIDTPPTKKRGKIVPLTKEAVFFDRTGELLSKAGDVGYWLGVNREKRIIDVATGQTDTYNRKGRGATTTYGDSSGSHDWDNLAASNALVDWTDIDVAQQLADEIVDPNTGEPVMIQFKEILVPKALKAAAERIISATEIRFGAGGSTSTSGTVAVSRQPSVANQLKLVTNAWVSDRTSSTSTWFIGDFKAAFEYLENWPITVVQAPQGSHEEFKYDIVIQWKASEMGVAHARRPRLVVKCTA